MGVVETVVYQQALPDRYRKLDEKELTKAIWEAKKRLGNSLIILGHHYQRDDVIQFADYRGDSLKLARIAAELKQTKYIVFCGVHFMAETADILTTPEQVVILPDLNAGCSMADMAEVDEVEECWDMITREFGSSIIPVTYVNSSAAIKAFVGKYGGLTMTSSNADKIFSYALQEKERILFLPDQHLGRNTAFKLGIPLKEMTVYDPKEMSLEYPHGHGSSRIILWKGHCSVHQKFEPSHVCYMRETYPGIRVIVHPECMFETVQLADENGSTDYIIKQIDNAPAGTKWAIGTEHNLVNRLAQEHPDQMITSLNPMICPCLTMNRIDQPHLLWSLESLINHQPVNVIRVDDETAKWAKTAVDRMLELS
ncbi:quinolinate synthase NadA [Microaerobacter geothermalis]|uniref:quinolinate synthase NadA n=1 Tax=Microaerobacter geothermalis TaxID=674972 RepID=UPI001F21C1FF|nr:quinolinate synthase NadA [Microaerobacter geothermalis]MCF6093079.1 quinolinate synthase NadA [Microaerobacter geothermalis]